MKTKVYAVAEKVPERVFSKYTAGKVYQVVWEQDYAFDIFNDDLVRVTCHWHASRPLDGGNWTRLELPDIDPRDVAELIEAAKGGYEGLYVEGYGGNPEVQRLRAILNKIEGDE